MATKWIQGAIKKPGAFKAKAKAAGMSTAAYGTTGKQARLAETLMGLHKNVAPSVKRGS